MKIAKSYAQHTSEEDGILYKRVEEADQYRYAILSEEDQKRQEVEAKIFAQKIRSRALNNDRKAWGVNSTPTKPYGEKRSRPRSAASPAKIKARNAPSIPTQDNFETVFTRPSSSQGDGRSPLRGGNSIYNELKISLEIAKTEKNQR